MAKNQELSVSQFNQHALRQELSSALIIQNQLDALTQDMVIHYPSEGANELQKLMHDTAGEALNGMLLAESKEAFIAQRKRLENLLNQFGAKLALDGDLDKALTDFRFYHQLQDILRNSVLSKQQPEWFSHHPAYTEWQEKLAKLQSQKNEQEFADYKSSLIAELLIKQEEQNLANLASLALIKQNIDRMSTIRLSYLPEINDNRKIFTDLAWILVGGLLVSLASLLGFAFPALVIPGIVVGAIVVGYGTIDFAKQNVELLSHVEELGERTLGKETGKELEQLERQFPGFEKGKFLEQQALKAAHLSAEKKLVQGLGYVIAFAGFALGVAGLFAVIPGLGIPMAGLITVAILAATVTLLATALWGYKIDRDQDKLDMMNKAIKGQMAADDALVSKADLGLHKKDQFSSSAKIFLHELEATKQSVTSLESTTSDALDDELERLLDKPDTPKRRVVKKSKTIKEEDDDSEGDSPPSSHVLH